MTQQVKVSLSRVVDTLNSYKFKMNIVVKIQNSRVLKIT